MRTRAQNSRDAALRRLTRVNRSLALAAVVGAGVVTDVVANTAAGHATTVTKTGETTGTGRVTLLTSPSSTTARKPRSHRHRAVAHHRRKPVTSGTAVPPAASGSATSTVQQTQPTVQQTQPTVQQTQPTVQSTPQPVVQPTPQPTVVAVSGGS